MTRFTIHKRKFLKKLAEAKKQIPDNLKNKAFVELIQNTKAATHKINEKCPLNLFKLTILNRLFITQLMIIQSQPMPKHKKGGILAENANIKNGVVSEKEIVIK